MYRHHCRHMSLQKQKASSHTLMNSVVQLINLLLYSIPFNFSCFHSLLLLHICENIVLVLIFDKLQHSFIQSFVRLSLPCLHRVIQSARLDLARVAGSRHFVFIFAFLMLTFTICIYQLACFASCFVAPAKTIHSTRTRTESESESSGTGYVTGLIAIYGLKRTNFSWHQPTRIQMR